MRFSLLNSNIRPGLPLLAAVCIFAAGNVFADPIEIVPTKGSTISTNINRREPTRKDFDSIVPAVKNPFRPNDSWQAPVMMPPPVTRTLTPREKELLDRRRNWVFMTPEEMMSGESAEDMLGIEQYYKKRGDKQPMTAMERYYENLFHSSRNIATNQFDRDSDSWSKGTNTPGGADQNGDTTRTFDSPFNSSPAHEAFRPVRPNTFSDVFGTGPDPSTLDPETIRAQQEQKAHMESFKELWDMSQPSTPAEAFSSGSSGSGSRSSSFPSMQPVLGTATPSVAGPSAHANSASAPPAPAPVHTSPPRPNFTMPQRPF